MTEADRINRVIHEWLGKGCYHAWNGHSTEYSMSKCDRCKQEISTACIISNPDYTTDLNAVREAELKVMEKFGWQKHEAALISAHFKVHRGDTLTGWYCVADASIRAAAVIDVIEGMKDESK